MLEKPCSGTYTERCNIQDEKQGISEDWEVRLKEMEDGGDDGKRERRILHRLLRPNTSESGSGSNV